ncbi:MAG: alpha/beta hydrolase [Gammaproteobacteria bacterium]|nr:alpha/beta hydrolase [Gammaproteobacteria bacterium]
MEKSSTLPLEVISRRPQEPNGKPPLLFVHGAFAGAWCWDEHFLPWFARQGYESHALSLRGHRGNGSNDDSVHRMGIADYVADLAEVAGTLDRPPVLIGHSMGGYVVQKYLVNHRASGMVLMASVPPTGLAGPAFSIATSHPLLMWQIGLFQLFGMHQTSTGLLHDALFSDAKPRHETSKYFPVARQESIRATIDMYAPGLPRSPSFDGTPVKVLGGAMDKLIAPLHVFWTGIYHGVRSEIYADVGHAMMLDVHWERVAEAIHDWLGEHYR